jgi:hypothetical protein
VGHPPGALAENRDGVRCAGVLWRGARISDSYDHVVDSGHSGRAPDNGNERRFTAARTATRDCLIDFDG